MNGLGNDVASRGVDEDELAALPPLAGRVVVAIAAVQLALHLLVLAVTQFGVQRDEFLYFGMGRHLRMWRMDFPPLIAVLANASRLVFGDSLATVRVFPAIEGVVLIVLAALVARELGGGRFAQGLAALSVLAAPMFMRTSTLFQPVVLDQIWWTLALFALARIARTEDHRWWWVVGVALGCGLLTKFSIAFVGIALLAALLVTPLRRTLATPWPWLAAVIALAIGSPSLVGQIRLGFPVVGQLHDLQATQLSRMTWLVFVSEQPVLIGVPALIIAVAGAGALIASRNFSRVRVVGLTCVFAFVLLIVLHGKSYYAGPIYPALVAAGAVVLEQIRRPALGRAVRWSALGLVAVFGVVALPIGMPVLSPQATAVYAARLGVTAAVRTNRGKVERLPQDYADMLGWEEQARALRDVYRSLSPAEQRDAVIVGENYGEAAAAEFYQRRYGLPPVVSTAGSYWFFGPGDRPGRVVISIGTSVRDLSRFYGDVREAAHLASPWSVHEERDLHVLVARQPNTTLQAIWPSLAGRN